jgi:RHS repeat-associated protein
LGHTRLLLDGAGNVVNRYAYDAWGNLIDYEEAVPNPFTWNGAYGYEYIPLTGLYHVGAREYDPRTARWLQRDPIEASSGDPHFWRYCGNDPLNGVDPNGLDAGWAQSPFENDPYGEKAAASGKEHGGWRKSFSEALNALSDQLSDARKHLTPEYNIIPDFGANDVPNPYKKVPLPPLGVGGKQGRQSVEEYEVGECKDLRGRSSSGDDIDIHHVPQQHPAEQVIPGYDKEDAPSIAIPKDAHRRIPRRRGDYRGTPSQLVEEDIEALRRVGVPSDAIEQLREMIRKKYGI